MASLGFHQRPSDQPQVENDERDEPVRMRGGVLPENRIGQQNIASDQRRRLAAPTLRALMIVFKYGDLPVRDPRDLTLVVKNAKIFIKMPRGLLGVDPRPHDLSMCPHPCQMIRILRGERRWRVSGGPKKELDDRQGGGPRCRRGPADISQGDRRGLCRPGGRRGGRPLKDHCHPRRAQASATTATTFPRVQVKDITSGLLATVTNLVVNTPLSFYYPLDNEPNIIVKLGVAVADGVGPDSDIIAFSDVCQHLGCNPGFVATGAVSALQLLVQRKGAGDVLLLPRQHLRHDERCEGDRRPRKVSRSPG